MLKVGAGKLPGEAEICTVTSVAAPPVGCTSIVYWAGCPGSTVPAAAVTVTHSCVAVGDAAAADAGPDPPPPGLRLGVGLGGGELGAVGRDPHTLLAATRVMLRAAPLLYRAQVELDAAGPRR